MFDETLKNLVIEAKEKLGEKAAIIIKNELQIDPWDEDNLKGSCPLGHIDKTPSFIWNPKNNSFHCFSCHANFGIIDLYLKQGMTYVEAVSKLFGEVDIKHRFSERGVKKERDYIYPKHEKNENREVVEKYLAIRKISKSTLDLLDVQQDNNKNIVFHYYDTNDVLCMVKYRPARKVSKKENKYWAQKGMDTRPLLFNMNKVDTSNGPLLICEGETSTLAAIEAGYTNTVGVPFGAGNYTWIEENFDWLELFDKIIVWSDNDEAGLKMRKEVCSRLGTWRTLFVDTPSVVKNEDDKNIRINDVNEILYYCGKQVVLDLIDNAQEIPVEGILNLAEVTEFDLENAPGLYTRIEPLDKAIYKFVFGNVVIVTGKTGDGKSSFVNQVFINEPLDQGYDPFLYSGELHPGILKNWIEVNMAGYEHVLMKDENIHVIKKEILGAMREWYNERVWVYNDKTHDADNILNKAIEVTRKYGVKVWILDNLMTISLKENDNNVLQKQKDFVTRLSDLAKLYGVLVVLVAHPRKTNAENLIGDDVLGAGAIVNMADYLLAIRRFSEEDKKGEMDNRGNYRKGKKPILHDVEVNIIKDRFLGKKGRIKLFFSFQARRFYSNLKELYKRYKWNKDTSPIPTKDPREKNKPEFIRK